ncbi:MAG: hypothetical protein WCX73_00130 [Candidatus Pacearchaeota archaeon]|jgi:ribosomal protein S3AE
MAEQKTAKVIIKKKKFHSVEIPLVNTKIELIGETVGELKDKTINLDLTRQLKGKSVEAIVKVRIEDNKAVAYPHKIKLMPYFIRRMIRKRISYIEDSFETPSQESLMRVKPFLITRKKVSKAVRKALRNRCKNWIEDYVSQRRDDELFNDILTNKMQRTLSLILKKTYPLSLCEIRVFEIVRSLKQEEIPAIKIRKEIESQAKPLEEEIIDQIAEIEAEKKKKAEKEIEKTQERALKVEKGKETAEEESLQEIETSKNLGSLGTKEKEEISTKKTRKSKKTKEEEKE